MSSLLRPAVAVWDERARYGTPPFRPEEAFPEFKPVAQHVRSDSSWASKTRSPGGSAYALIRSSLACYDTARYGTPSWNPLGAIVRPGQSVVIKPNLVIHERPGCTDLVTHGAVIRCLLDYTCLALGGSGRITICDAPVQGADFRRVLRESGLDTVLEHRYWPAGITVSLVDLRSEWAVIDDASGYIRERVPLGGDPAGDTLFDLGGSSALEPIVSSRSRLAVGDYDALFTSANHQAGCHRYRFSNSVLDADVVLSVAKMKTHQKAGVTGALKNVVGMNTSKDYLPHFRTGPPPAGDEYPPSAYNALAARARSSLQERIPLGVWRRLRRAAETAQGGLRLRRGGDARYGLLSGSWQGNDTVWRMVADINRIALYGARDGRLRDKPQRRLYHFVDGIVAGEGEGPLRSTPRPTGIFLHGGDPAAVDGLMASLMGFDPEKVPLIAGCFQHPEYRLTSFGRLSEAPVLLDAALALRLGRGEHFRFQPPRGWPALQNSAPPGLLARLAESSADVPAVPPFSREAGL